MKRKAPYQLLGPLRPEEYAALEADIKKRGVQVAVEKDESGNILDGHNRAEIAERLGQQYPTVTRRFAGEGEKREHVLKVNLARRHLDPLRWGRAFRLLLVERQVHRGRGGDRRSTDTVSVDTVQGLAAELGVNERTARRRLRAAEQYDALPAPERAAVDAGEKTVHKATREVKRRRELKASASKNGKAPKAAGWEIRRGDCLAELRKLEAGCVALAFADPPYNIGVDYGDGGKADRLPDEDFLLWCDEWVRECVRVLAADGCLWVLIGDEYADHMGLILRAAGVHRRAWVKWYETFGVNCANNFNRCSRHLFYCVKDRKRFTFNAAAVNRPSDRQTKYEDGRADPGGKLWDDVWQIPRLTGTAAERLPDFPTQLPLDLLRPVIGCSSSAGDTVLDPFCGSGTTGHAAIEMGRKFIGIEKQARFVELAMLRLKGVFRGEEAV